MKPVSINYFKKVRCSETAARPQEIYLWLFLKQSVIPALILGFLSISARADITVTDDLDYQLTLDQPAKTIIALSPHLTELTFEAGAGDKLIARVNHADYPEQANRIPSLGSFNNWSIEQVIALQPELVLVWLTANGEAPIARMRALGIKVYVSEPRNISDISKTIRDIGRLTGDMEISQQNAAVFDQAIAALRNKYTNQKAVRAFYQVWSQPLMTINGQQLISKIIELCGGENVFGELTTLAPKISREGLLMANPEVIIGGAQASDQTSWRMQWQQWPELEAVKNQHLYFIHPDLLNRQTGRMLHGAEQMCHYLDQVRQGN